MFSLKNIVRKNILNLVAYSSARDEYTGDASVFLDANENPYSISGDFSYMNRYPEPQPQNLILEYAAYNQNKINKDNIIFTRGADEGIEIINKSFKEFSPSEKLELVTSNKINN